MASQGGKQVSDRPLSQESARLRTRSEPAPVPGIGLAGNRPTTGSSPDEAERLLAALTKRDRPIWATALYAGLRAGELQALAPEHVDLANGVIRAERSWDRTAQVCIAPKSRAGHRRVPILGALWDVLVELRMTGSGEGRVFPSLHTEQFDMSNLYAWAHAAWQAAGLEPILMHECRHTLTSPMIAGHVNVKALQVDLGHSTIATTMDLYGHLMPVGEAEAAALADA